MQITLKPWSGNERLYFYRQSQQLSGETGQIGKLRADFDRSGNGFFSSWEDIRGYLKTDEFKKTFDDVINELRFGDGETPFAGRRALAEFLRKGHSAMLPNDGEWHGFRVDVDNTSLFFRVKPSPGDYDVYAWCYKKDWLDDHMLSAEKGIRFIDSQYNEKFRLQDGGKIRLHFSNGETEMHTCRYIDDTHMEFDDGSSPFSQWHICQFAEQLESVGATVEPLDEPMNQIHVRFYCPLKLAIFERDKYGELENEGYDLDGRYAARYEDKIKKLLENEHSYDGCDPKAMASYQKNPKIRTVRWDVENVNGTLYGCMHVDLAAPLTATEEARFCEWLTGQNSDGFGEGLEQREFEVDDGEGYISFWNCKGGYFVKNERDFRDYIRGYVLGSQEP